ncbi:MAG: hypothetical protein Ta2G_12660 [Termitinemataceae bacterium]|nr:MAG: hypothetical protein Ta2G_12660 [Termitinemataceae bacterium]
MQKTKLFLLWISALLCLTTCKDFLYNDLALQGVWEKTSQIDYENVVMNIKFDSDYFYYKTKNDTTWSSPIPSEAGFGSLTIKKPNGSAKGTYTIGWTLCFISKFEYNENREDNLLWLNGTWTKK